MSSLTDVSKELGRVVSQALPGVVLVQSGRCASSTGVLWTEDSVVTAASRLTREEGLEVAAGDERRSGRLAGVDAASDLALVRLDRALPMPARQTAPPVALGELVLALGRAPGAVVRLGVVSRLGGEWRLPGGGRFERYIESDIVPTPSLSGGPLVDASGALVGVNSVGLARGRLVTLPIESVARIVDAITTHGRVRRARLGVSVQRVELPARLADRVGRRFGLIVLGVQPNGAADKAGLELGDVLLQLGSSPLERVEDLQAALEPELIDTAVDVVFLRAGAQSTARIVPTANE